MGILLEEYDTCREALIEPSMVAPRIQGFPKVAVTCYSNKALGQFLEGRDAEVICHLDTEDGNIPVYRIHHDQREFAVYMSRVGAPACVVQVEEMIARGIRAFVMFGSCGVLDGTLGKWHIILPTAAFRDEGVSYHYLPAADEITMQDDCVQLLKESFDRWQQPYICGKVWTTDAIYRETKAKTAKRREQGCIAVDMECAAVHAVAQFRGVKLAQFFYAEDSLNEEAWDSRGLSAGVKGEADRLFQAALDCAAALY